MSVAMQVVISQGCLTVQVPGGVRGLVGEIAAYQRWSKGSLVMKSMSKDRTHSDFGTKTLSVHMSKG